MRLIKSSFNSIFLKTTFTAIFALPLLYLPSPASAESPTLNAPSSIKVGNTITVSVENRSGKKCDWQLDRSRLQRTLTIPGSCIASFKAKAEGSAWIKASFRSGGSATSNITITGKGKQKLKPGKAAKESKKSPKSGASEMSPQKVNKIQALLDSYKSKMGGSLVDKFNRQGSQSESQKVSLSNSENGRLTQNAESFFQELANNGFTMQDVMEFKKIKMKQNMSAGESAASPGKKYWDSSYLGVERALMMGRVEIVQSVFNDSLLHLFKSDPKTIGVVYGQMDIGSWAKQQLKGLDFKADIDLSSLSTAAKANRALSKIFKHKLSAKVGLTAQNLDAILTPHGQAGKEVFIGEWGKAFAEMDMLKRSSWKLIEPVLDSNGKVVDIKFIEKPGQQLFWEHAFRKGEEFKPPRITANMEPMMSLEMLRHMKHDIVDSNAFSAGDKVVKLLKYVERSYAMNKKATAGTGWNPFDSNDPALADMAKKIVDPSVKSDPAKVAAMMESFIGQKITLQNVDGIVQKITERASKAISRNSEMGLSHRLRSIADIKDEDKRRTALDDMWNQMKKQIKVLNEVGMTPPEIVNRILDLAMKLREGGISPEYVKYEEMFRQMVVDVLNFPKNKVSLLLMGGEAQLRSYCKKKLNWPDERIDKLVKKIRTSGHKISNFFIGFRDFNNKLTETMGGSKLLQTSDWLDNGFAVYESYMNSPTASGALWAAASTMGEIGVQMKWPIAGMPIAVYHSFSQGSPKPLGMAAMFYFFPSVGMVHVASQNLKRLDTAYTDKQFYNSLEKMLEITEFNQDGKVTSFKKLNPINKTVQFEESVTPPGDRQQIADICQNPERIIATSPGFKYWNSLIPDQGDYHMYATKLERLGRYFPHNEEIGFWTTIMAQPPPEDGKAEEREKVLREGEKRLRNIVWIALADALESAAKSADNSKVDAWKEKIKELEEEFGLTYSQMAKDSLQSRIDWEITKQTGLVTQMVSGDNIYAVGLIYEKYINAYTAILEIKKKIKGLWISEAKLYKFPSKPPIKFLFYGKKGSPVLTGDPAKDTPIAEKSLLAHVARVRKMKSDLRSALARTIEIPKDQDHLKVLGKLAYEYERLLDDTPARSGKGSEANAEDLKPRAKAYKAYLDLLRAAAALDIQCPDNMSVGETVTLRAVVPSGKANLSKLRLEWSDKDRIGEGATVKYTPKTAGSYDIRLALYINIQGKEKKLAEKKRRIQVTDEYGVKLSIRGTTKAAAGSQVALNSVLDGWEPFLKKPRFDWTIGGKKAGRNEASLTFIPSKPSSLSVKLQVTGEVNGKPKILAQATHTVMVSKDMEEEKRKLEEARLRKEEEERLRREEEEERKRRQEEEEERKRQEESEQSASAGQQKTEGKQEKTAKVKPPKSKKWFLNCLCYYANMGGNAGGFYKPERHEGSPSCRDTSGGPCVYDGFGCWRNFLPNSKEAIDYCTVEGNFPKGKYTKDDVDKENKKFEKPLQIKLTSSKHEMLSCEKRAVSIKASAKYGRPPYKYSWPGHAAKDSSLSLTPKKEGATSVSVTVTDSMGNSTTASVSISVKPVTLKIKKTSPQENKIVIGQKAEFEVMLSSGGKEASCSYTYQWEPHPRVTFSPHEGTSTSTTAKFTQLGNEQVWVKALEKQGGSMVTVAESDQIAMEVISPSLTLTVEPKDPMVGQEAKAIVKPEPDPGKGIDFRWMPLPKNAKELITSPDARELLFIPKDTKPIQIEVLGRVPGTGEDLGRAQATVQAKPYKVTVKNLGPMGPKPMVWKAGVGLVEETKALAVHQNVRLRVDIQPAPKGKVHYKWTLNADSHFVGGSSGQEVTVNRSQTGTCTAMVEATDKGGNMLGKSSGQFSVSISQRTLEQAKKTEKGQKKIKEAKAFWEKGQVDKAVLKTSEAVVQAPGDPEVQKLAQEFRQKKAALEKHVAAAKNLLRQSKLAEAKKELNQASKLNPKYGPLETLKKEQKNKLEAKLKDLTKAEALKREAEKLEKEARYQEALEKLKEANKLAPVLKLESKIQTLQKAVAGQGRSRQLEAEAARLEKEGKLREAKAKYGQALQVNTDPKEKKRLQSLERGVIQKEKDLKQAQHLSFEGTTLFQKEKYQEAKAKFEQARKLAAPAHNAKLNDEIKRHLDAIKHRQTPKYRAGRLRYQAAELEKSGSLVKALPKYEAAQRIDPDPAYESKIKNLRDMINAHRWRGEGAALERQGKLKQALAKYQAANKARWDQQTEAAIRRLSKELEKKKQASQAQKAETQKKQTQQAKLARAQQLVKEGAALEQQGKFHEALKRYEKAYALYPDPELGKGIKKMKTILANKKKEDRAVQLINEGKALDQQGKAEAALRKYEEAYRIYPDPELLKGIEIRKAALAKAKQGAGQAQKTRRQQATPPGKMLQGTFRGPVKGKIVQGNMTLTIVMGRASGSFTGTADDAKAKASISASYNPKKGSIKGTMYGTWWVENCSDPGSSLCKGELGGTFQGTQRGNGFSGTWEGSGGLSGDGGTWSVRK